MSNNKISELPVVKYEDIKPLYTSEEIIEKLAMAVNVMREMKTNSGRQFDLELMYSLAIAIRDKKL